MRSIAPASTSFRVEYAGSFMVIGDRQQDRLNNVRAQLECMRDTVGIYQQTKTVTLEVSVEGFRVVDHVRPTTCMTHRLRRVSYATCDPEAKELAFCARQPVDGETSTDSGSDESNSSNAHPLPGIQYCHVFRTESSCQTKQINLCIGDAFRMAARISADNAVRSKSINLAATVSMADYDVLMTSGNVGGCASVSTSPSASCSSSSGGAEPDVEPASGVENVTATGAVQPWPKIDVGQPVTGSQQRHKTDSSRSPIGRMSSVQLIDNSTINLPSLPPPNIVRSMASDPRQQPTAAKRHKRRPLSAILTNFSGRQRPTDCSDQMPISPGDCSSMSNGEQKLDRQKSRSILKKLLHLTVGVTSGAKMGSLSSGGSSDYVSSSHVANTDRLRSIVSDSSMSGVGTETGDRLSKRRRRPLSAVFSLGSRFDSSQNRTNSSISVNNNDSKSYKRDGSRRKSVGWANHTSECSAGNGTGFPFAECSVGGRQNVANVSQANMVTSPIYPSVITAEQSAKYSVSLPDLSANMELVMPLNAEEEQKLNSAAWYSGLLPRHVATQVLQSEPEGTFLVRQSVNQSVSTLVLSVRVPLYHNPTGVSHYIILRTTRGFRLKGFTKDFRNVHALVTHHSFMCEQLPCRLVFTDWLDVRWPKPVVDNANVPCRPYSSCVGRILPSTPEENCFYGKLPPTSAYQPIAEVKIT